MKLNVKQLFLAIFALDIDLNDLNLFLNNLESLTQKGKSFAANQLFEKHSTKLNKNSKLINHNKSLNISYQYNKNEKNYKKNIYIQKNKNAFFSKFLNI